MVIEKLFERVFESFAFIFLLILVWSAILGLSNPPSWYSFVTYYEGLAGDLDPHNIMVSSFFGDLVPLLTSLSSPDPVAFSAMLNGASDATTVFKAIGFFINLVTGGIGTILLSLIIGLACVLLFLTRVVPLFTGVAYFFAGSFFVNGLPGVVGTIDWQSLSGWLGYPDPVVSSVPVSSSV